MSINESHANQIKIIKSVLIEADELEEKYKGLMRKDLNENFILIC